MAMTQEQADALKQTLKRVEEHAARIEQLEEGITIQRDAIENVSEEQTTAEVSLQNLQTQQDAFEQRQTNTENTLESHLTSVEQRLVALNQKLTTLEARVTDLATVGVSSTAAKPSELDISKLLQRPTQFDMSQEHWETFKFQLGSWIGSQHSAYPDVMEAARKLSAPIILDSLGERDKTLSIALYAILVSLIPKAAPILRGITGNNGLEAWRTIYQELEPKLTQQKSASWLKTLSNPTFPSKEDGWSVAFHQWTSEISRYENETGKTFDADIKYATLQSLVPEALKKVVGLYSGTLTTFDALAKYVEEYLTDKKKWERPQGNNFGLEPKPKAPKWDAMDIDAVGKGKDPKGKGKGKGNEDPKGKGKGNESDPKGKGKGKNGKDKGWEQPTPKERCAICKGKNHTTAKCKYNSLAIR